MHIPTSRIRRRLPALLVGVAVGALVLGGLTAPANAAPHFAPNLDPNTPVASIGAAPSADLDRSAVASQVAGFAGLGVQSIILPDTRVRVTPTTVYPASASVMISLNGVRNCSGWMLGPNLAVTAGHCVHTGGSGGTWHPTGAIAVWPGRDGTLAPYGSCAATNLFSVVGWTQNGDEQFDYGAVQLNCGIGNTTGWYGMFWQTASLNGLASTINGYPQDKPAGPTINGQQWQSVDQIRVTETRQVFYFNDTLGGMSGSPVYQVNRPGCGMCAMAIHAYGLHGSAPHSNHNHGTRIVEAVFNNLLTWSGL